MLLGGTHLPPLQGLDTGEGAPLIGATKPIGGVPIGSNRQQQFWLAKRGSDQQSEPPKSED